MTLTSLGATTYPAGEPSRGALFVLAHGAGAGQRHPFMVAAARGLSGRGLDVVTFDFPYIRNGRKVPDKAPPLEAAFREVIEAARAWSGAPRLFVGGKSMGGRMATHLASQGQAMSGVVALGYPLHPPGKPEQPRTAHLPAIRVPVLIVQGERDTFGTPDELAPVLKTMTTDVTLHVVRGADHSLGVRGKKLDATLDPVLDAIAAWTDAAPPAR